MGSADVSTVEDQIRTTALTKRIRLNEFFIDYDNLRSGFVTGTQFFRVLWENLGVRLGEDEERALASKYDVKEDGTVNWRQFCESLLPKFDVRNLSNDPLCQEIKPKELLGTSRTIRPLSPDTEEQMERLLRRLARFYRQRGISLRNLCADIDKHNMGFISDSQFYRFCPRPSQLSEDDLTKLVLKYRVPDLPGFINFFNLSNDLDALTDDMHARESPSAPRTRVTEDFLPHHMPKDRSLQELLDHIRVTVYRSQIRSTDFFRDYDPLRCGLITENQFGNALVLAVAREAKLKGEDVQKVIEFYRAPDGRIHYKEFCDMLESAFNVPELDKKPLQEVIRPGRGALGRSLPILTDWEEERVSAVLALLRDQVVQRRLMVYPFFRDYERGTSYGRVVTPTQFGRVLSMLSLLVPHNDFQLLCRKFTEPVTGDINYPGFVQCIDKQFVNYTQDVVKEYDKEQSPPVECDPRPDVVVDLDHLIPRIRHIVLVNRIRVKEFFEDYDPLRTGSVHATVFERCLGRMGLDSLGEHHLTAAQLGALQEFYRDPCNEDLVLWTRFEKDINIVFNIPHLEKTPSLQVPPSETFIVPKPGTMDWRFATDEQRELCERVMERLTDYVAQRRAHLLPFFKDFDKHNNGHITRNFFRRALQMASLHCSEQEMGALEARFFNDCGVDYMAFMAAVEPVEAPPQRYVERLKQLHAVNSRGSMPERSPEKDLENVLMKIKTKVFNERVRVHDFMCDYDALRSGRMLKTRFRRALDLCRFELSESEVAILEDHYQSARDKICVDYPRFSADVETVFVVHALEKTPTREVVQFHPPAHIALNALPCEKEQLTTACLKRVADRVREVRIQLFPLFSDFDRIHNGTVTRDQFRRVLTELELAVYVPTQTEWFCLFDKFSAPVGGSDNFNYLTFCDVIYGMAGFEFRHP